MLADDLYAMAGSIEHLIRILTAMTNAVEDLDVRWKEKSLKIVAWTLHRLQTRTDHRNREQKRQNIYIYIYIYLARDRGYGSAWHMAGQSWLF